MVFAIDADTGSIGTTGVGSSTAGTTEVVLNDTAGSPAVGGSGASGSGAGAFVGPQSGIHKDVGAGVKVLGSPQREERLHHRLMAAMLHLPDLLRRVRKIEKQLGLRGDDKST